jgi:signal peptidase I
VTPDPATPAPDAESGAEVADDQEASDNDDANPETNGENETSETKRKRSFWRDLTVIVIAALVLTILLKAFVVQVFSIPSASMENTLLTGDRILVNKMVYRFRSIDRGDIVVFSGSGSWDPATPRPSNPVTRVWDDVISLVGISGPGTDYVKRVIGVPGDHVVCCNAMGQITVNGVPLSEKSYIYPGSLPSQIRFNITVPPGRLWVMGDNRADSDDSRYRVGDPGGGTIPETAVVGRAFLIIFPLSRIGDLPIPNTFQQAGLRAAAAVAAAPPVAAGGGVAALSAGVLVWRRRRRS